MPPRLYDEINSAGDRILYTARIFKQGAAPRIVITGGNLDFIRTSASSQAEASGHPSPRALRHRFLANPARNEGPQYLGKRPLHQADCWTVCAFRCDMHPGDSARCTCRGPWRYSRSSGSRSSPRLPTSSPTYPASGSSSPAFQAPALMNSRPPCTSGTAWRPTASLEGCKPAMAKKPAKHGFSLSSRPCRPGGLPGSSSPGPDLWLAERIASPRARHHLYLRRRECPHQLLPRTHGPLSPGALGDKRLHPPLCPACCSGRDSICRA